MIIPFLSGGLAGAVLTITYNRYRGRIQSMKCLYIEDDVISKIPLIVESEVHSNVHMKKFLLKNTTGQDQKEFSVIFEFDKTAKIIRHTDTTKSGIDRLKKRLLKPNEYAATIRNFNRNDEAGFTFEIGNVSDDLVNITEDGCIGFRIVYKDRRKTKAKSRLTVVKKDRLQ